MHEREKLEEAKYFYSRMLEEQSNRVYFKHNLSAFLSAARSVLQYAFEEAKTRQGGYQWYDNLKSKSLILGFFKHIRDVNIHEKPIKSQVNYDLTIIETVHISDSILIEIRDKDGNIKGKYLSDMPQKEIEKPRVQVESKVSYKFIDGQLNGKDVFVTCQKYIKELEEVIKEGISRGYIIG